MAKQRESVKVADPFDMKLRGEGWHIENLHGNAFQQGLPDRVCFKNGRTIFIEYKVIEENGRIKCTDAQKRKFPKMLSEGAEIYCIAANDISGHDRKTVQEINYLYNHIILSGVPNAHKMFIPELWSTLNPFYRGRVQR